MSDDARFDPRFDPAFQPGYKGPIGAAKSTPDRPAASTPVDTIAAEPQSQPQPQAQTGVEVSVVGADDERPTRGRNPFLIALGAVAVLLVGVGLYLISRLRDLFADTQSTNEFDYVTLQVLLFAAPLVLVLGLATGIGLLFVFAQRWGRR